MPRKKIMPSKDTMVQASLIAETIEAVSTYVPVLIRPPNVKILLCLARAYLNNEGLIYSRLAELTGLGTGRAFDYPIECLIREGFIRAIIEDKNTVYMPTDAGLVAARGIVATVKIFVEEISRLDEVEKKYPAVAEGYKAIVDLEKRLAKLSVRINHHSLSSRESE